MPTALAFLGQSVPCPARAALSAGWPGLPGRFPDPAQPSPSQAPSQAPKVSGNPGSRGCLLAGHLQQPHSDLLKRNPGTSLPDRTCPRPPETWTTFSALPSLHIPAPAPLEAPVAAGLCAHSQGSALSKLLPGNAEPVLAGPPALRPPPPAFKQEAWPWSHRQLPRCPSPCQTPPSHLHAQT